MYLPTKEHIRRALLELLAELPMDRITVRMVSQRAGISRQAVYNHYHCLMDVVEDACRNELETLIPLEGAVFSLYRRAEPGETGQETEGIPGETVVTVFENQVTDGTGRLALDRLIPGTYYLREDAPPEGHRVLRELLTFRVLIDDVAEEDLETPAVWTLHPELNHYPESITLAFDQASAQWTLTVPNPAEAGYVLPCTGGPGTRPWTAGGLLLLSAAAFLAALRPRRMGAE